MPSVQEMFMNPVEMLETAKAVNPLVQLQNFGQSIWLDYIRRDLLKGGELQRLITEDGLRGMTSNPAIFEKAVAGSTLYQDFLDSLAGRTDLDAKGRYELLAIRDIQDAADLLRPVYQSTKKRDGYVSLEVSPYLAHDTAGTLDEARRLWKTVARENVMIKAPGTGERCRWHARRGAAALEDRRPRKRDDQGPGHSRRHTRISPAHQRGDQRQR